MEQASVGFWYIRRQSSPLVTALIYRYISCKHNYLVVSFLSLSMQTVQKWDGTHGL